MDRHLTTSYIMKISQPQPNLVKGIYKDYIDYILLNDDNMNALLLKSESRHIGSSITSTQHCPGGLVLILIQGKGIKSIEIPFKRTRDYETQ